MSETSCTFVRRNAYASEVYTSCVVTSMTSPTADSAYSSGITYTGCDDTASGTPSCLRGRVRYRNYKRRRATGEKNGATMQSENDGCRLGNYERSFITRSRKRRKRVNLSAVGFFAFYEIYPAYKKIKEE